MERRDLKAFLDTHAAIFLWEGRIEAFGADSRRLLERAALLVSPMVRLEMTFLREVGKIESEPVRMLDDLETELGVLEAADSLPRVIGHAEPLSWTRDPFDRLIVATALLHDAPLVSRDRSIQQHYSLTIW